MCREEIRQFFVRFRGIIMAVVLVALGASGMAFFLDNSNEKRLIGEGDDIYAALQQDERRLMQKLEEVSNDAKDISASLAKFKLAAQYTKNKNIALAKELYYGMSSDKKLPRELRELAEYFGATLTLGEENLDQELENRLVRLASNVDSVYRSSAKEALVILKLKRNDVEAAIMIMKEILGDPAVNADVKKNMESMFRIYGNG